MQVINTTISDLYIIEPDVFGDHRGWFMESWSQQEMAQAGLYYDFVQDNHSYSANKGTIRGLHFQKGDLSQAKLVRCIRGIVLDIAVDIRKGSPTYKKWVSVELSAENHRELLIPRGFAHGFATLTDDVEFLYRADNYYNPQEEGYIRWDDSSIAVNWGLSNPTISNKDANAPLFDDNKYEYFLYQL